MVKPITGHLEPFSRDKLFISVYKACQHRPTALTDAAGLTETIIGKLAAVTQHGAIETKQITQITQVALNRFDAVASVSYQAFHA